MTPLAPLQAVPQWIVVMLVPLPNGKTDKIPCNLRTGETHVDAHNPAHWADYATAAGVVAAWGRQFVLGFVLTARDPFWCLDIDGALQADGTWSPLALSMCAALPGTAVEVSQSGKGLHVWGQGVVPPHSMKRVDLHAELYSELRFIALGHSAIGDMSRPCTEIAAFAAAYFPPRVRSGETPQEGPRADWRGPEDDAELLRRAMRSQSAASVFGGNRASFADLWTAEATALARAYPPDRGSSEPYDRSSADAALAQHLAFWTGCDVARIERLMQQSALKRDKWEQRDDYLVDRTIMGACSMQRDVLHDPLPEAAPVPSMPAQAPGEAPKQRAVEGSTFLSPNQQAKLFEGCIYIVDSHKVLVPGGRLLTPDRFRATFGGYTFAMDARNERTSRNAFEALTESQALRCPQADGTCFLPQLPYGAIVQDAGRRRANTWWPVETPKKKGDVSRFLTHIQKLFPDTHDQTVVLSYMAATIQHPGVKFQFALFIQGVEGNGKTFLSRALAECLGRRYVHWPKASKIAKQFNGWMVGKVLFCVEDIHTSEHTDVIEELKVMITGGDGLEIEAKGVDQVSAEICANFMVNSNHRSGVRKTRNDRRWCVIFCAQQDVEDLARDGMGEEYMTGLYDWAKAGGYAAIHEYLSTYPIPDTLNPATHCQRAPRTSSTDAAIEQGLGRIEQEVLEAVEQERPVFAGGWISSVFLDRLLTDLRKDGAMPPNKRRDLLVGLGYQWHPHLPKGRVHNIVLPDAGKPKLFIRKGHPAAALRLPAEIARAYTTAQGVA